MLTGHASAQTSAKEPFHTMLPTFGTTSFPLSERHRPIAAKFRTVIGSVFDFIIRVQNFGGPPPKKFRGQNIWHDFGRLQSSTANISRMDEDIQNRTSTFSTAIPPALGEERSVNLWSTNHGDLVVKSYPRNSTIPTPKGCCAPKFLHALENDQVLLLLAHPHRGRGFPCNFFQKGSKLA